VKPWDPRKADVAALLKRKGKSDMIPGAPRVRRGHPEEDAQRAIVRRLEELLPSGEPVFWSATLNGVRVSAALRGRLKAQGLRPGVFDLVFIPLHDHPRAGVAHWIEVKTDTGKLTAEQSCLFDALHPVGLAQVCRTPGEVEDQLRTWGMIP